MTLKHLLVHIDSSQACSKRIEAAVDLAKRHGARLTGLHITPWSSLYVSIAAQIPPGLVEKNQQCAKDESNRLKRLFIEKTDSAGVEPQWVSTEGDVALQLIEQVRYADLLIMGRDRAVAGGISSDGIMNTVPLRCGRPVLYVPSDIAVNTMGSRILVAWDKSQQATRAVADAMTLLQNADVVHVVTAAPPGTYVATEADMSLLELISYLESHGVTAMTQVLPCHESEIGLTLLAAAHDNNADLLVMGAYGHSRLSELILGGATRYVMNNLTLPTLVSH